jgi:3-deoxy-7-phosphoheptulonate synthase
MATSDWTPESWQRKAATQQATYPEPAALRCALASLAKLPPLVTSWEVERLKGHLADAARGEKFLLQGGDCAESFDDCRSEPIAARLKILLKMSFVLLYGSRKSVIRVGRFAGQYAKPRTADTETCEGRTLPSFRGHMINRPAFTPEDRTPDPNLLLRAYERSALTLNFIRGLVDGGFADLHHPEFWDLQFVSHSKQADEYRQLIDEMSGSVHFLEAVAGRRLDELTRVEFFTSHEGLHLPYEQAQTRQVPRRTEWYNLSTHFPWIGDRTRALDGAHVEYFRGIANPIGVKIGPGATAEEVLAISEILNPANEPGRLTFIHRFGAKKIGQCLPPLVEAMSRRARAVLWCCDPMHGNTIATRTGLKTRSFDDILEELRQAFDLHHELGSVLGGVHFELTGENVTECLGGARGISEADLSRAYRTDVDPRLNYEQALELAFLIARRMKRDRK